MKLTTEQIAKIEETLVLNGVVYEDIKLEFNTWMNGRKYAPTIHALKAKLNDIKDNELNFQRKKLANFDEEQAELISKRIIQKITNHFASHLKDENTSIDESIDWIEKVFQIGFKTPKITSTELEEKYKINLS